MIKFAMIDVILAGFHFTSGMSNNNSELFWFYTLVRHGITVTRTYSNSSGKLLILTLSCIMLKNGQTYFKNLVV